MSINSAIATALIAAAVSVICTLLTTRASSRAAVDMARQTQFQEIIKKRIEHYPNLWKIHINYETHWTFDGRPKTREWAQEYLRELSQFNLEGGVFFSQGAYTKFFELRNGLWKAVRHTRPGEEVAEDLARQLRFIVYGGNGEPGLATYLKDDLGSYEQAFVQRPRPLGRRHGYRTRVLRALRLGR